MISAAAAVLAARLASGILLTAGAIRWRHPIPAGFLRFLTAASAAFFALAAAIATGAPDVRVLLLLLFGAALLLRFGAARTPPGDSGRLLASVLILVGLASAVLPPLAAGGWPVAGLPVRLATHASGSLLLGSTTATMVLGHWYLVDTSLSIRPLATGASLLLASTALRISVVLALLLTGGAGALAIAAPADLIFSTNALFFGFRAITGLVSTAVLAVLIRKTVRIRSTQSATGLLYVMLILAVFGELTAAFLEIRTGGALG